MCFAVAVLPAAAHQHPWHLLPADHLSQRKLRQPLVTPAHHPAQPGSESITAHCLLTSDPHSPAPSQSYSLPPQADGLCSNDGVIIQTVTSDPTTAAETLSQSQLVVTADQGQGHENQLAATSLLEGSEGVATETQEPITADHFSHKVKTQHRHTSVEKACSGDTDCVCVRVCLRR